MNKAYYFPMMALYLETFTDAVVQDWRGFTDLFPCLLPAWEGQRLEFKGIRTAQGVEVSGYVKGTQMEVTISPVAAKHLDLMISGDRSGIRAEGMKSGPVRFDGNVVEHFVFDGQKPIRLSHR